MATIKVTVKNGYLHGIVEEFICCNVDVSDLAEIDYCVDECIGQYLDMHGDAICARCPDLDMETINDSFIYIVEEDPEI